MDQVLFVLHEGAIFQWWINRGKLSPATLKGASRLDYSAASAPQFWEWWLDDNNVGKDDIFDALFLSSSKDGFGELPACFRAQSKEVSSWKFEMLSSLVNDPLFEGKALVFVKAKDRRRALNSPELEDSLELTIQSVLDFTLPKEEPPAPPVVRTEPIATPKISLETSINRIDGVIATSCPGDEKANNLRVGDKITGVIKYVSSVRRCCYIQSPAVDELLRINNIDDEKIIQAGNEVCMEVKTIDCNSVKFSVFYNDL